MKPVDNIKDLCKLFECEEYDLIGKVLYISNTRGIISSRYAMITNIDDEYVWFGTYEIKWCDLKDYNFKVKGTDTYRRFEI